MNPVFEQISLAAGGSHYPTINPDLQQRFGELVIDRVIECIGAKIIAAASPMEATVLGELRDEVLRTFELNGLDSEWDPAAELQRIIDEFDMDDMSK